MSMPGLFGASGYRRPGSSPPATRLRLCDETPYAAYRPVHYPRYSVDPDELLMRSIQQQFDRLSRHPNIDYRGRQRPSSASSQPYRSSAAGLRTSHAPVRPSSAGAMPEVPQRGSTTVSPSPTATPRTRRVGSASLTAAQAQRLHPSGAVAVTPYLSAAPHRTEWSRQRRKEELLESGLEPMQNLIGLGGYFVQRPHFAYRPLSATSDAARTVGVDVGNDTAARLDDAVLGRATAQTASLLPHASSASSSSPTLFQRSAVRRPTLPSSAAPHTAAQTRGEAFFDEPRPPPPPSPQQRMRSGASVAAVLTHDGGAAASVKTAEDVSGRSDGSSRTSSATVTSQETEDIFFDEEPLATKSVPTASAAEQLGGAAAAAAVTRLGAALAPLSIGVRNSPAAAARTASGHRAVRPRADESLPGHSTSVAGSAMSEAAPPPPATAAVPAMAPAPPATTSSSFAFAGAPRSPRQRHQRTIEALLHQLLRVREKQERMFHHEWCPCGVCDDSRCVSLPLWWQRGQTRGQRRRPPSPAGVAGTSPARGRLRPSSQHGRRASARPAMHASNSGSHYEDDRDLAPHARHAEDGGEEEHDACAHLYGGYRRCDCCNVPLPRGGVAPVPPPPRPRGSASSDPRVVHRQSSCSSAAVPASSSDARARRRSRGPQSAMAPPPPPPVSSYWFPYHDRDVSDRRPFTTAIVREDEDVESDVGRGGAEAVPASAALGPRHATDTEHYLLLIELLQGLLDDRRSGTRASSQESAAAGEPTVTGGVGAPARSLETALQALRADGQLDDGAYAELLRLLGGGGMTGAAGPTPATAPSPPPPPSRLTTILYPYNIQDPMQPTPPSRTPVRCDVAVETMMMSTPRQQTDAQTRTDAGVRHEELPPRSSEATPPAARHAASPLRHSSAGGSAEDEDGEAADLPDSIGVSSVVAAHHRDNDAAPEAQRESWADGASNSPAHPPAASAEPRLSCVGAPAATGGVAAPLHDSVLRGQLRVLVELEASLRASLADEESQTRSEVVARSVGAAEGRRRRALAQDEAAQWTALLCRSLFGRDRILVTEAALREWAAALEVEAAAWGALLEQAAHAAAAETARAAAAEVLGRGVAELGVLEDRGRRAVVWTEALVRHELQMSMCGYAEEYARDDIVFAEALEWTAVSRADAVCRPAPAEAAEDGTSTALEEDEAASGGGDGRADAMSAPPVDGVEGDGDDDGGGAGLLPLASPVPNGSDSAAAAATVVPVSPSLSASSVAPPPAAAETAGASATNACEPECNDGAGGAHSPPTPSSTTTTTTIPTTATSPSSAGREGAKDAPAAAAAEAAEDATAAESTAPMLVVSIDEEDMSDPEASEAAPATAAHDAAAVADAAPLPASALFASDTPVPLSPQSARDDAWLTTPLDGILSRSAGRRRSSPSLVAGDPEPPAERPRSSITWTDDGDDASIASGSSVTAAARRRRVRPAVRHRAGVVSALEMDDVGELLDGDNGEGFVTVTTVRTGGDADAEPSQLTTTAVAGCTAEDHVVGAAVDVVDGPHTAHLTQDTLSATAAPSPDVVMSPMSQGGQDGAAETVAAEPAADEGDSKQDGSAALDFSQEDQYAESPRGDAEVPSVGVDDDEDGGRAESIFESSIDNRRFVNPLVTRSANTSLNLHPVSGFAAGGKDDDDSANVHDAAPYGDGDDDDDEEARQPSADEALQHFAGVPSLPSRHSTPTLSASTSSLSGPQVPAPRSGDDAAPPGEEVASRPASVEAAALVQDAEQLIEGEATASHSGAVEDEDEAAAAELATGAVGRLAICTPNLDRASGDGGGDGPQTAAEEVSHGSLADSPAQPCSEIEAPARTSQVTGSKAQQTHYGSLDSDALTPVTRRVRGQCWEENSTAAQWSPGVYLPVEQRPQTPEFVRSVLAHQQQLHQQRDATASGGEEDSILEAKEDAPPPPPPHRFHRPDTYGTASLQSTGDSPATLRTMPPNGYSGALASATAPFGRRRSVDGDVWSSGGAPDRFGGLPVRVPSPHPRALRRGDGDSLHSFSASASTDADEGGLDPDAPPSWYTRSRNPSA